MRVIRRRLQPGETAWAASRVSVRRLIFGWAAILGSVAAWTSTAHGLELKSVGLCETEPPYRFIGWKDKYLGLHNDTKKTTCWPPSTPWCCATPDGTRVKHAHLQPNLDASPPTSATDLSPKESEQARSFYYKHKPYATRDPDNWLGPASFKYNCHAYALAQTGGIEECDLWVTDPTPFYKGNEYLQVTWNEAGPGDVCLHYVQSEDQGESTPTHSSVLVFKSDDPATTTVKAKIGQGCVWENTKADSEEHWGTILNCFRRSPTASPAARQP